MISFYYMLMLKETPSAKGPAAKGGPQEPKKKALDLFLVYYFDVRVFVNSKTCANTTIED